MKLGVTYSFVLYFWMMKKILFILLVGVAFIGCEEYQDSREEKEIVNNDNSKHDTLEYTKEQRADYLGWNTFVDKEHQIRISYPPGWKAQPEEDNNIVLSVMKSDSNETTFQENFHVIISEVSDSVNAAEIAGVFYIEQQELYKNVGKLKFIDEGFMGDKFDGSNWFLEYEIERENKVNMYSVNMFFHQKNKLYVICFYTIIERKERMDQTFDKISRSFKW